MEYATCHLYFLHIHTHLKARVYTENTSDAWHIPQYPTRKHCITSMYTFHTINSHRKVEKMRFSPKDATLHFHNLN